MQEKQIGHGVNIALYSYHRRSCHLLYLGHIFQKEIWYINSDLFCKVMKLVASVKWRTEKRQGRNISLVYDKKWRNVRIQVIIF